MSYNNDWITLDKGADVETRVEPVVNSEGVTVSYNKSYRTITTVVEMETFTGETSFTCTVGVPVTDVATVISDQYRTTKPEIGGGEHTKTTQTVSSWAAY